MSKVCNRCKAVKQLAEFPTDARNRDGRGGQCRKCKEIKTREWQSRHAARVQEASRRWKRRNPEKVRAYSKTYWAENSELEKERRRAWIARNPGVESYYSRLRRDRKRGAQGNCSFTQLRARWEFYGGLCWMCREEADTVDHVIALAVGGTEWPANLRPACRSCNSSKGIKRISGLN